MDRAIEITDRMVAQVAEVIRKEEQHAPRCSAEDSTTAQLHYIGEVHAIYQDEKLFTLRVCGDEEFWRTRYGPERTQHELLMHIHKNITDGHLELMVNHLVVTMTHGTPHEQKQVIRAVGHEFGHMLAGHHYRPNFSVNPRFDNWTDRDHEIVANDPDGVLMWLLIARRLLEGGWFTIEEEADRYGGALVGIEQILMMHGQSSVTTRNTGCRLELQNRLAHHYRQLAEDQDDYLPKFPHPSTPWSDIPLVDIEMQLSLLRPEDLEKALAMAG